MGLLEYLLVVLWHFLRSCSHPFSFSLRFLRVNSSILFSPKSCHSSQTHHPDQSTVPKPEASLVPRCWTLLRHLDHGTQQVSPWHCVYNRCPTHPDATYGGKERKIERKTRLLKRCLQLSTHVQLVCTFSHIFAVWNEVMLICPVDGTEEIANPFASA